MASRNVAAISAFIEGAPPGELTDVVNDIKALTSDQPSLLSQAAPAFRKYNEEQLTVVKLPGSSKEVLISSYNSLGGDRYYDPESKQSWAFDHITQKATAIESYTPPSPSPLLPMLSTSLAHHASEHYPTCTTSVLPPHPSAPADALTLLVVSSKYSPQNYYTGRLRATYHFHPPTSTLTGSLKCDVHYYEDGNVRLTVQKTVPETKVEGGGEAVVGVIARVEKKWQEELGRGFAGLSEGSFKGLRRQLPVTRQKMEWEKVGGLRVGREIGGVRR